MNGPDAAPDLSLVVPVWNEGASIGNLCREAVATLGRTGYELLVCYDFDDDDTLPALQRLPEEDRPAIVRTIRNTLGPGVRYAIEAGMRGAAAPVVIVMMADGSDDFETVPRLAELVREGADVASASRYMPGGAQEGGPLVKRLMSRAAGLSLHWLAGLPTRDPTNSFKAYSRSFLERTPIESEAGFSLGLELTVKAHYSGGTVRETPTRWRDRTEGASRFRLMKWLPSYLRWYGWAFDRAWLRTPVSSRLESVPRAVYLVLASLAAAAITLVFFAPPISRWRAIGLPAAILYPETARAADVLQQLQDPWMPIENRINRVIEWRLLFPLIGHYLRLPPAVFLALPLVGCLAALAAIAHFLDRNLRDRTLALFGTVATAGCVWFFVSTGWLSYNDSWIVLALVVLAFANPAPALLLASAAGPWIDERFLLLAPVCFGLRHYLVRRDGQPVSWVRDGAAVLAGIAPYVIIRLAAVVQGSGATLSTYFSESHDDPATFVDLVEGGWNGLRALWIYVIAFFWLARREASRWHFAGFSAVAGVIFTISLFIAADISRSVSVFIPVALAGIVLLYRYHPRACVWSLPIVMAANLLLPARHVMTAFRVPMAGIRTEWRNWKATRDFRTVEYQGTRGRELLERGRYGEALAHLDAAIQLDPAFAAARFNRAVLLASIGDRGSAVEELDRVVQSGAMRAEAHLMRGIVLSEMGHVVQATQDLRAALDAAPADWPYRDDAIARLRALQPPP